MDVDGAGLRHFEDRLGEDQAISRDDGEIRVERPKPRLLFLISQRLGLPHLNAQLISPVMHCGFALVLAAACGSRRL